MAHRPSFRAPVLAAIGLAALGAVVYFTWARPNLEPRNFGVVEAGRLYRSAALTPAALARVQREHGIRTIVDLGGFDKDPVGERLEQRTAAALGLRRFVFNLEGDGTGNPNAYIAALWIITDPGMQPVLVHCSSGAQRTSGCVMLYKDIFKGQDLDQTYSEARRYRHDPGRNPRLLPFLKEHEAEITRGVRQGRQIESYPVLPLEARRAD